MSDPQRRAFDWLRQQGVHANSLTPLSGYTNHVFLVGQSAPGYPQRSVLRLADFSMSADLCPLAYQFDAVLQRHVAAAELGFSPDVIASERETGAMWLDYAGVQKSLRRCDYTTLRGMLTELYVSGLDWGEGAQIGLREMLTGLHVSLCSLPSQVGEGKGMGGRFWHNIQNQPDSLLRQAEQRGYFDYPLVPIHGDLNPGNLLHDGQRWWLIDWDFSGMQCREWDLAGLIVEHGWGMEQALAFAPNMTLADIKWFCSCCALLSWHWHVQRGSDTDVIANKAETVHYWITLRG